MIEFEYAIKLEICHSNEEKNLLPAGDEVFSNRGKIELGHDVNQVVFNEWRGAIVVNQVDCKELWIIGQGDAYCALVS